MTCRTVPADEAQPSSMGAEAVTSSTIAADTAEEESSNLKWQAGSKAFVQTR